MMLQVWCLVWGHLDGESLMVCRGVCREWRQEISRLVSTSHLARDTFLTLLRLLYHQGDDALEHRKSGVL